MLAVGASLEQIEKSVDGMLYEVGCINSPKATVLSGTRQEMDAISKPL
jgi:hypothetical protein